MNHATCSADGCERESATKRGAYCNMHRLRLRRTGSLEVSKPLRPGGRGICTVEECGSPDCGQHGYCKKHWSRVKRHGAPDVVLTRAPKGGPTHPLWKGDDVGFHAVHRRLGVIRGKAATHACVDCGRTAQHWSYSHTDPAEAQSDLGPYSTDLTLYDPRCAACHKKFDLAWLASRVK